MTNRVTSHPIKGYNEISKLTERIGKKKRGKKRRFIDKGKWQGGQRLN